MEQFINQLDSEYTLGLDIKRTLRKIKKLLPLSLRETSNLEYNMPPPAEAFLSMTAQFERLIFSDNFDVNTITQTIYKKEWMHNNVLTLLRNGEYNCEKSGILIIMAPRTQYQEYPEYNHMTAVETTMKTDSHHFFKVFFVGNIMVVYTNKALPFETVLKLKMLQWSATTENIVKRNQDVIDLPQAFLDKNLFKINELINKILKCEAMQELKFDQLKELFKPNYDARLTELENRLKAYEDDYTYYEEKLRNVAVGINQINTELEATKYLSEKKAEDNTDLIKYLLNHPYIKNVTRKNNHLVDLYYEAPIIYFDEFVIEKMIHNWQGDAQAILKAFLDNKYELMTQCEIEFDTETFAISPRRIGTSIYFGHPHIDRHSCLGNHRLAIAEAAKTMNFLGAIEQISQAVLNLNFTDGVVIRQMILGLLSPSYYHTLDTWRSKETGELLTTEALVGVYK